MKLSTRKTLKDLAATMRIDQTNITEFGVTQRSRKFNKKGSLIGSMLQIFKYKSAKPVNNFRRLKKAYRKGGANLVVKTVEFYAPKG